MTDEHAGGEPVPVVARPAVLVDQRREEQRGVGDPAGDHDVGTLRERVGDRERAEVRGEEQRVGAHGVERRAGLDVRERGRRWCARTSSSRGMRSSPITVAIFSPETPAARAVSIAACAAARGLIPPALVMTFVRPSSTAGQRGAEVAGEVARVPERLVARPVLLQDRERQLRERLEAEVVDAVLEQPGDRTRRVAVEALPAADADGARDRQPWVGARRWDQSTRPLDEPGDLEQQVLAARRGDEVRARPAARSRSAPTGSEIAGWPVWFATGVNGVNVPPRPKPTTGSSGVCSTPSAGGSSPSVGVSSRSQPSAHHCGEPAGERAHRAERVEQLAAGHLAAALGEEPRERLDVVGRSRPARSGGRSRSGSPRPSPTRSG